MGEVDSGEEVRFAPYSDSLVYRASFPFGSKRTVELAVALPAFDAPIEAGTGDETSMARLDAILKEEHVPTPYLEEIYARLPEMLKRQRFAESSSLVTRTCLFHFIQSLLCCFRHVLCA